MLDDNALAITKITERFKIPMADALAVLREAQSQFGQQQLANGESIRT
jgi:hypothetical protein